MAAEQRAVRRDAIVMLHPEDAELRETRARLRSELAVLLLQKDDLLLVQGRRIEAAYLKRFGALELKVYETYCDYQRARRKANEIRARVNRGESVDEAEVDAALDDELSVFREKLNARMEWMNRVLTPGEASGLTAAGREELKALYRRAVKALHPDLHPEAGETEAALFRRAMDAYRYRDLGELRAICEALPDETSAAPDVCPAPSEGLDALRGEIKALRKRVRAYSEELEQLKQTNPYRLRVFLEDEQKAAAHRRDLMQKLRGYREAGEACEAKIRAMLNPEEDEA